MLNPNAVGSDNYTRLQRAIRSNDLGRVKSLIISGANVNQTGSGYHALPLLLALEEDVYDIFHYLLTESPSKPDPNLTVIYDNRQHLSPLMFLCMADALPYHVRHRRDDAIALLLENGADGFKVLSFASGDISAHANALHIAITNMQTSAARRIIATGTAEQLSEVHNGKSYAHVAISSDNADSLNALLAAHAAIVNIPDAKGNTAVHAMADTPNRSMITSIVHCAGVDLSAKNNDGETPLMRTVAKANMLAFYKLLQGGGSLCNINAQDNDGNTALHLAVGLPGLSRMDRESIVGQLLANGADISIRNNDNETALHVLARHGNKDDLRLADHLLRAAKAKENGASVDMPDADGRSALFVAAVLASDDIRFDTDPRSVQDILAVVDIMIDHGANPSAPDWRGFTPLDRLAERGDRDSLIVHRLIKAGGRYRKMYSLDELADHKGKIADIVPKHAPQKDDTHTSKPAPKRPPDFKM